MNVIFQYLDSYMDDESEVIVVDIVVGHEAKVRDEPTPDGLTHTWTVFVQGQVKKHRYTPWAF